MDTVFVLTISISTQQWIWTVGAEKSAHTIAPGSTIVMVSIV
jgi:hypothetical protein